MNVKRRPTSSKSDWDIAAAPTCWINHASRLVLRRFEQALRPLGFGMAYLPVLVPLEESGPQQQKELAKQTHVEQPVDDPTAPDRFIALGFSRVARLLFVVHLERGEKVRIITARRASRSERKTYEQRRNDPG